MLSEYLKPVFFCITGFTMIYVVWDLLGHINRFLSAETPPVLIAKFYVFMLAPALPLLIPASLLLATLFTLWNLTRSNQITALRASGVSLQRIMLPFILVGVCFSLFLLAINETYIPNMAMWAEKFEDNKYRTVTEDISKDTLFINGRAHRVWQIGEMDFEHPEVLKNIKIIQERPDKTKQTEITADRAEWLDGQWWLFSASRRDFNDDGNPMGKAQIIPHSEMGKHLPMLRERPDDIIASNKSWEFWSAMEIWKHIRYQPNISIDGRAALRYDMHNRLAMPWACLVVTLFGIPAGARSGRQSILNAMLLVIAAFLSFYALNLIGLYLAKQRILAEWVGAWLSNIVFLAFGLIMSHKLK